MANKSAAQGQQEDEQNERISDLEQQQPSQQAPVSAAPPSSMPEELNQLTTLHQQGALTDAEFSAAKAKLLGT